MELLLPFLVFAAFMAYFAWRGRREGMSARQWIDTQNRALFSRPGWWKPAIILPAAFCVVAVITGIVQAGFQWWYLLIPVVVFGMFAAWAYAVTRWARRYEIPPEERVRLAIRAAGRRRRAGSTTRL